MFHHHVADITLNSSNLHDCHRKAIYLLVMTHFIMFFFFIFPRLSLFSCITCV